MKIRYTPWLVGLGALTGAALVAHASFGPDAQEIEAVSDTKKEDVAKASGSPSGACEFDVGDAAAWQMASVQHTTVDTASLGLTPADTAPVELKHGLSLTFESEVLRVEDDHALHLGHLREVSTDTLKDVRKISTPFLFRVGTACDLQGFAYLEETPRPFARVQQAILYDFQWRLPERGRQTWGAQNGTGAFESVIATSVGTGTALSVHRRINAYSPWAGNDSMRVEESILKVDISDGPWFDRASLEERLRQGASSITRTLSLRSVPASVSALSALTRDESEYVWEDLLPLELPLPEEAAPTVAQLQAQKHLRGVPLDEALGHYVKRVKSDAGIQATWPPLRDWLEANPGGAGALVDKLKSGEMPNEATMGAYIALGNARTPQAKQALMGIMEDTNAPTFERSRAILSLIDRADTGADLASLLSGYALLINRGEDRGERILARQAMLALGAMSGRKPADKELKELAVTTVSQALTELEDGNDLRPAYNAIANMGDPAQLHFVSEIPMHSDREVRKAAARVFRRMAPSETSAFVAGWLERETSWQVKRELYSTLELQTYDANQDPSDEVLRIAMRDLRTKPGIITRKDISRMLVRALERRPNDPLGIKPFLKELIPYELEQKSGLYAIIAAPLDPVEVREVTLKALERQPGDVSDPVVTIPGTSGGVQ